MTSISLFQFYSGSSMMQQVLFYETNTQHIYELAYPLAMLSYIELREKSCNNKRKTVKPLA